MMTLEKLLNRLENLLIDLDNHEELNQTTWDNYCELEYIINSIREWKDEIDNSLCGPVFGVYFLPKNDDVVKKLEVDSNKKRRLKC